MIKEGADVCQENIDNETPLHHACMRNNTDAAILFFLLNQGAIKDINKKNKIERTPLHYACESIDPNIQVIEWLILNGAIATKVIYNTELTKEVKIYMQKLQLQYDSGYKKRHPQIDSRKPTMMLPEASFGISKKENPSSPRLRRTLRLSSPNQRFGVFRRSEIDDQPRPTMHQKQKKPINQASLHIIHKQAHQKVRKSQKKKEKDKQD